VGSPYLIIAAIISPDPRRGQSQKKPKPPRGQSFFLAPAPAASGTGPSTGSQLSRPPTTTRTALDWLVHLGTDVSLCCGTYCIDIRYSTVPGSTTTP
jgi:hypothetical protein